MSSSLRFGKLGRADLLRLEDALGEDRARQLAVALGYEWRESRNKQKPEPSRRVEGGLAEREARLTPSPSIPSARPAEFTPFWRPVHRDYVQSDEEKQRAKEQGTINPFDRPEAKRPLEGQDLGAVHLPPPAPPIAPPAQLRSRLDSELLLDRPSRELDVDALTDRISRGDSLHNLPFRSQSHLSRLVLILDAPHRLMAVWRDQLELVEELGRRLGADRIRLMPPPGEGSARSERPPDIAPDETLLALTDLGFYGGELLQQPWLRLGRRLRSAGARFLALVPCPAYRWNPEVARLWRAIDWSSPQGSGQRRRPEALAGRVPEGVSAAEALLRLLAPAVRIEPGLLRAVRRLLGVGADLGTEIDAWHHPAVAGVSTQCLELDPVQKAKWQSERLDEGWDPELVRQVTSTVIDWHKGWSNVLWASEVAHYRALGVPDKAFDEGRVEAAAVAYARATHAFSGSEGDSRLGDALDGWWSRETPRSPEGLAHDAQFGEALIAAVRARLERDPNAPLPPGVTPDMLGKPKDDRPFRRYELRQHGQKLLISPKGSEGPGSLVVEFDTREKVYLGDGWRSPQPVELIDGRAEIEAPLIWGKLQLSTDYETITLQPFQRPSWATRAGRDGYGAWASFEVEGVEQRMRWIPPGRFVMGSPEGEEGRFMWEQQQHEVILSEGFWMAETPCIQALWEVVMGSNPSEFETPDRPVENVSWEDCQVFIDRLNFRVRDLEFDLPSEAEWEYACRSGTATATWKGDLEILGEANSPTLERIAWYRGNSGVDFDLANGRDASGWDEKAHDFDQAGTRRVGQKLANPWGLRDALGNVWEWCWDWRGGYASQLQRDPEGPDSGEARVLRGGSWFNGARNLRAASRLGNPPSNRDSSFGFRLSRGPKERGAPGGARGGGETGKAARGTRASPRARRTRAWVARLGWAVDGGLDEYGRWAVLEVKGVRHKLRWMYPGTFQMGSPSSEAGRFSWEGPRHEVTLTNGFWLGEVPCTQELWTAVTGEKPSEFVSELRPVENVSWEDCQEFFSELRRLVPGFLGRLPTEAQWEYACRAGTDTAAWVGDLELLGERNAPVLDDIAWYGGNSGVGFDLTDGRDSSEWKEKQYDFDRAGTRLVGEKQCNPWGLHDMLGNVWEWCEDAWSYGDPYPGGSRVDPSMTDGEIRVLRGGSWFNDARRLRAAYRNGSHPSYRYSIFGFRLSRGPQELPEAEPQGWEAAGAGGGADRGTREGRAPDESRRPRGDDL
ncbi:MAG: formylglycine-generating enzyme family protein [Acidobacteriota bacterium]